MALHLRLCNQLNALMGLLAFVQLGKIQAEINHITKVRSAVHNSNSLDPANLANHHTYRFGKWYDTDGKTVCGNLSSFRAIDAPHERIHALAKEAVAVANNGNDATAQQLFDEFEKLSHVVANKLVRIKKEFDEQQRSRLS